MTTTIGYNVAVVGATGAVGAEMIAVLEQRRFPVRELVPLASAASRGKRVRFQGSNVVVRVLDDAAFAGCALALFSAGHEVSQRFAPRAARAGAIVIDNTSAFRMDDDVPLVVPEVNPEAATHFSEKKRIIANPNCSTIQMVVVLAPLHREAEVKRVVVATYQSASGAGKEAMEELAAQSLAVLNGKKAKVTSLPQQIAFNCFPHIDLFRADGFSKEEWKMMAETTKILNDASIRVVATCVRVPVFTAHAEAITIEFAKPLTVARAQALLAQAPGVTVIDDPSRARYPMAIDAAGKDPVFVGRIRRDPTVPHGLALWIVADNLRKGAALNAVQIAELLHERALL